MSDALSKAVSAHRAAQDAREALRVAVVARSVAVQAALAAGVSAADLAKAFGVHRERVYMMAKQGEK